MDRFWEPRKSSADSDETANILTRDLLENDEHERRSYSLQDPNHIPLLPENLFLESMGGASIYTAAGHEWVQQLGTKSSIY